MGRQAYPTTLGFLLVKLDLLIFLYRLALNTILLIFFSKIARSIVMNHCTGH
jgi:hypothetical protein